MILDIYNDNNNINAQSEYRKEKSKEFCQYLNKRCQNR
jgi:hypothetical protein